MKKMTIDSKTKNLGASLVVVALLLNFCIFNNMQYSSAVAAHQATLVETAYADEFEDFNDIQLYKAAEEEETVATTPIIANKYWEDFGCSSGLELHELLETSKAEALGMADAFIAEYSDYLDDSDKKTLIACEDRMATAVCMSIFQEAEAQFNEVAEKAVTAYEEAMAARSYSTTSYSSGGSGSYYYSGGSGVLTRSGGVAYGPSGKETWYSQRVLPGGGLNIPGRHVDGNGIIRDGDGYIVVATPSGNKGAIVETTLGTGKVYDTNAGGDSVDVYTNW